jgi:hypothetical protein
LTAREPETPSPRRKGLVGLQVLRRLVGEPLLLGGAERDSELLRDARRDVGLHLEDVGQRRVEGLLPPRGGRTVGADLDELRAHLHAVARAAFLLLPADGGGQEVVRGELLRDLLRRLGRLLVGSGAAARDHLEAGKRRELAADRIRDAVGEVVVLGSAQVLEREDGDSADRGFRRRGRGGRRGLPARRAARTPDGARRSERPR